MVASKLPQILQLNPADELVFQGPFNKVVTSFLKLKNPSNRRVCFKVKTTAPRRYCVRPNSGIVEPDAEVRIAIMLQPLEPEYYSERSKHKFMIQSTIVRPEEDSVSFDEIWANALPEHSMDSKLKCKFIDANENQSQQQQQLETSTPDQIGSSKKSSTSAAAAASTGVKQTTSQESGDGPETQQPFKRSIEAVTTSTPINVRGSTSMSSTAASAFKDTEQQNQGNVKSSTSFSPGRWQAQADKSLLSSQNLTSSFHQSVSEDKKVVLISLIMLILGVILGKYII